MNHGLQHLGCRNNWFTQVITFFDHHFLKYWYLFGRDFYTEVTASNHEAVCYVQNFIDIFNAFSIFNFCNNLDIFLFGFKNTTDGYDIFTALHKGCCYKVHTLLTAKAQVRFVLFRYRWQAKSYTWHSHAFTVTDFTTVLNSSNDVIPFDGIDVKCYKTISQEDFIPNGHIAYKTFVVYGANLFCAFHIIGSQCKLLACLKEYLALFK